MGDYFLFNLSLAKYLIGAVVLLKMKKLIASALIAISGLGLSACGVDTSSSSYKFGYVIGYGAAGTPNLSPDSICADSTFNLKLNSELGWVASAKAGPYNEGDAIAGCLQGWRDSQ